MSRTATATPPPPLFHQKNSTPSARHVSKGNSSSLAAPQGGPATGFQRHFKKSSRSTTPSSPLKTVAPMSASDMLGMDPPKKETTPDPMSIAEPSSISWNEDNTDAVSIANSVPSMSAGSSSSDIAPSLQTPATTPSSSIYGGNAEMVNASSMSSLSVAGPPPRSWVNGFGKMARAAGIMNPFGRGRREGESPKLAATRTMSPRASPRVMSPRLMTSPKVAMGSPALSPAGPPLGSPYIAPSPSSATHSSNCVSPMAFMITPAPEVAEMNLDTTPLPPHALPPAVAHPHNMPPALAPDSPPIENPAEALRRYEWAEEQRRQVTEFARLCSQWPQSGYNQAKYPGGHTGSYVPQSWANPRHVIRTMQRQAELEKTLCDNSSTFFAATHSARSASTDGDSDPSVYSHISSQSSLATSVSVGESQDLCAAVWAAAKTMRSPPSPTNTTTNGSGSAAADDQLKDDKTASEIRAAMASPMVDSWRGNSGGEASIISVSSVLSVATTCTAEDKSDSAWQSLANSTRSLSELDHMAELQTSDRMDVDEPIEQQHEALSSIPSIPGSHPGFADLPTPTRTQSCPAKRPLTFICDDEDKRRRVTEPMIVDDTATSTPVFSEEPAALPASMSLSVPNLMSAPHSVGGHIVKTSHSHPLVISPFLPVEIMPALSKYIVTPYEATAEQPIMLASELDVPSLLLSCAAVQQCATEAGPVGPGTAMQSMSNSMTLIFNPTRPKGVRGHPSHLGNLLLSSCPGKRLRMDGPVRGRGPVYRDLRADMRRIRTEGAGAVVCCLDDEELALLGVPWETYREVAGEVGLDVIRLPMPDGFTPVSLQLFDAQVSVIVTRYTLKGINVLVHCRGGVGRAGLTACAWAIKMGFVQPHPSLALSAASSSATTPSPSASSSSRKSKSRATPATPIPTQEEERAVVMSIVERSIAMIRCRRGLKAIESMEQVQFLAMYVTWLRESLVL